MTTDALPTESAAIDAAMPLERLCTLYGRERGCNCDTVDNLRSICRLFERFLHRPVRVSDLNDENIEAWLAHLVASGNLTAKTQHNRRAALRTLWRFAHEMQLLPDVPPVRGVIGSLPPGQGIVHTAPKPQPADVMFRPGRPSRRGKAVPPAFTSHGQDNQPQAGAKGGGA